MRLVLRYLQRSVFRLVYTSCLIFDFHSIDNSVSERFIQFCNIVFKYFRFVNASGRCALDHALPTAKCLPISVYLVPYLRLS